MQAGLGGGSSDAAAALRALGRALARRRRAACARSAAALGADVPYFLEGGTALGLERGDLLFPLVDRAARVGRAGAARRSASARRTRIAGGTMDRRRRHGRSARRLAAADRQPDRTISQAPVAARHPEIGAHRRGARGGPAPSTPRCRAAARPCSACFQRAAGAPSAAARALAGARSRRDARSRRTLEPRGRISDLPRH